MKIHLRFFHVVEFIWSPICGSSRALLLHLCVLLMHHHNLIAHFSHSLIFTPVPPTPPSHHPVFLIPGAPLVSFFLSMSKLLKTVYFPRYFFTSHILPLRNLASTSTSLRQTTLARNTFLWMTPMNTSKSLSVVSSHQYLAV